MNREIEFRAWDKIKHERYKPIYRWYDWEVFEMSISMSWDMLFRIIENWWPERSEHESLDKYKDRYILMQYTWLKDKNWKKIFEGDIVCEKETVMSDREEIIQNYINIRKDNNFKYFDWTIGKRRYWQQIYIVERDESSCWFEPFADSKHNCWHCWWWINWNSIEIIGNIYENPELLSIKDTN